MKIIVAGAGETGMEVASRFARLQHDVVLVEIDEEALALANEALDVMTLEGNATHRTVLRNVGTANAQAFVALTTSDTDNIVSAGLAKQMGAKVSIARVDDPEFYQTQRGTERGLLGIDAILCATRLAAAELLGLLIGVEINYVGSFASYALRSALVPMYPDSPLHGKSPKYIALGENVRLGGIVRDGFLRSLVEIPRIETDDSLLLVGHSDAFFDAMPSLMPEVIHRRAMIVGGGDIGAILAQALSKRLNRVELIERHRHRAELLSEQLPDVTVLHGDARQASFLRDLHIENVSYLLAVTADDEINLLVSLLARQLGVPQVFSLLRQPGHTELFRNLGIKGVAGAFEILANAVQEVSIVSGLVRSVPIPGTAYLLVEWRLPSSHNVATQALNVADLPLDAGINLVGLTCGDEAQVPKPETSIAKGVTLLISTPKKQLRELSKNLDKLGKELQA